MDASQSGYTVLEVVLAVGIMTTIVAVAFTVISGVQRNARDFQTVTAAEIEMNRMLSSIATDWDQRINLVMMNQDLGLINYGITPPPAEFSLLTLPASPVATGPLIAPFAASGPSCLSEATAACQGLTLFIHPPIPAPPSGGPGPPPPSVGTMEEVIYETRCQPDTLAIDWSQAPMLHPQLTCPKSGNANTQRAVVVRSVIPDYYNAPSVYRSETHPPLNGTGVAGYSMVLCLKLICDTFNNPLSVIAEMAALFQLDSKRWDTYQKTIRLAVDARPTGVELMPSH